jgi:uridine phosphorylase
MNQPSDRSPSPDLPLLAHALDEPTAFRPEDLVAAVRQQRGRGNGSIPQLCVLEFDGDLTDKLITRGEVRRCEDWPCFHTEMWLWPKQEPRCGIVARTIGGPYTVLVAEQLAVCGVKAVVGLASAGRIGQALPLPGIVVADEAVRDEGTSLHYLPPAETVPADHALAEALTDAMDAIGLPIRQGLVWTTDAPYRETRSQIEHWASRGALAVEMQAASLFAFGQARGMATGLVAHVTNASDHDGEPFHKGPDDADVSMLAAIVRIALS